MHEMSKEIWKELLPPEKEVVPHPKPKRPKNAPPHADRWSLAILLERAAYLRKLSRLGDGQASETLLWDSQRAAALPTRWARCSAQPGGGRLPSPLPAIEAPSLAK